MSKGSAIKLKKKILSTLSLITLALLGFYLIFQPQIDKAIARSSTDKYKISNISAAQIAQNAKAADEDSLKNQSSNHSGPTANFLSKFSDQHSLPVTGLVSIPDININLPIFNDDSNAAITYGASNVRKTKMGEGNYSLASHYVFDGSTNRLFTPLINAKKGTKIYVTDKIKVYTYEINEIFDVDQYAVSVLNDVEDQKIITLITCADFNAEYRHIYRGKLVDTQRYSEASETVKKSFEKEFNL